jgi:hypothetical protein
MVDVIGMPLYMKIALLLLSHENQYDLHRCDTHGQTVAHDLQTLRTIDFNTMLKALQKK